MMDCVMLSHAQLTISHSVADNDRAGHRVHFATKTDSCHLLADTCMVRLKLHWLNLLLTSFTNKFSTNPQQIKVVEFEP